MLRTIAILLIALMVCPYVMGKTVTTGEIVESVIVPGSVSDIQLNSDAIDDREPSGVDEALDFLQGVRVIRGAGNKPNIMLRGFGQDRVLVLIDGMPLSSPYDGFLDLSHITVQDISKIKIIKGAASPLYGANALGGVINIITKSTKEPVYTFSSRFLESGNSFNRYQFRFPFKKFRLGISGLLDVSQGFQLNRDYVPQANETGGLRGNSDHRKNNDTLKLAYSPSDTHDIELSLLYVNNEKGAPPHASSDNPEYRRITDWKKAVIALNDTISLDKLNIRTRVYYDDKYNVLDSYDDSTYTTQDNSDAFTSIFDSYAIGAQLYMDLALKEDHIMRGSVNMRGDVLREQEDAGAWSEHRMNTYSIGFEDSKSYFENYTIKMGASFDMHREDSSINPVLNMLLYPDKNTTININMARKTLFPTMKYLFDSTFGNILLEPQENVTMELGLSRKLGRITGTMSLFGNSISNLIDLKSTDDSYQNISSAYINGLEIGVIAGSREGLSCKAGYALTVARDRNPASIGRNDNELPYIPGQRWDLGIKYRRGNSRLSLLGIMNGVSYYYNDGLQDELAGYSVWNLRYTGIIFTVGELSVSLNNILDRDYMEENGYPRPGRTLLVSLGMKL